MTTLADLTTLRVGGPVRERLVVDDDAALIAAVGEADAAGTPLLLIGGGSNLLCADAAFDGRVVQIATRGIDVTPGNGIALVDVAAGEPWDELVAFVVDQGWSGIEAMSGVPGLVGATPIQNVGAYGQDVGQVISHVTAFDRRSGHVTTLDRDELAFGYRTSMLKRDPHRYVVLSVAFAIPMRAESTVAYSEVARALGVDIGGIAAAVRIRETVLALRRAKGMVIDADDTDTRSAGSFFMNPVVDAAAADAIDVTCPRYPAAGGVKLSAAWLIEHAGIERGWSLGTDARVSTKHTLALVNGGTASATDILELARAIRERVRATHGITLEPEPRLVGCAL